MQQHFRFSNLRELLAKANEEKSGDQLAGIAASSERERVAAKLALADLPLLDLLNDPVVPPEEDEVSGSFSNRTIPLPSNRSAA